LGDATTLLPPLGNTVKIVKDALLMAYVVELLEILWNGG